MGDDSTRPPATGYPVHSANGYPAPRQPQNPSNPYFYPNYNNNYPYNQPQPPNPYYAQHPERTAFIRRVIAGMMSVFIVILCIFFITWLVLRPKFPEFTVDDATVTGFNLSSSAVSGSWDFRVTAFNPNKKVNIEFEEVESNLAYKGNSIADNTLAPFTQGKRESTRVRVAFAANGAYLRDKAAVALSGDRSGDGVVGFEIRIYARVLFDAGVWRVRRRLLKVLCDNVMINIAGSGSGNMTGGAKGCRVGW